ncbi:MAG: hypothetical protein HY453_01540 [Parcubacteria group bacterium]|nr:hypothetical protein [Parcubacteria group bacterium]
MFHSIKYYAYYSIIFLSFAFLLLANTRNENLFLGTLLLVAFLLFNSWQWGRYFFNVSRRENFIWGGLFVTAFLAIAQSPLYYFWKFDMRFVFVILFGLSAAAVFFNKNNTILHDHQTPFQKFSCFRFQPYALIFFVFFLLLCLNLWFAKTTESIASPLLIISPFAFFTFFMAILAAVVPLAKKKADILPVMALTFVTLGLGNILLPLGYGFDGFIHLASEQHIFENGFIEPLTPYYIGYYMIVEAFHGISKLPLSFLNAWIALLVATTLPFIAFATMRRQKEICFPAFASFGLLFFFNSSFTTSTPSSLALAFATAFILFEINERKRMRERIFSLILGLAMISIHPLIGIPMLFFWSFRHIPKLPDRSPLLSYFLKSILFSGMTLAIPVIFFFQNKQFSWPALPEIVELYRSFSFPRLWYTNDTILNILYFFGHLVPMLTVFAIVMGISQKFLRRRDADFLWGSVAVHLGAFFTLSVDGNANIIEAEQSDFAQRLFLLSLLLLLPFFFMGFDIILQKTLARRSLLRLCTVLAISMLFFANAYFLYPRDNRYEISRFHSISAADFEVAATIETIHRFPSYIVLGNQTSASAALREYGFKNRFLKATDGSEIYFYPIPTGQKLYQWYLAMVYDRPSYDTVEQAMKYAQVQEAYFIIHDYWHNAPQIIEEAKAEAADWYSTSNGKIHIFRYFLRKNSSL